MFESAILWISGAIGITILWLVSGYYLDPYEIRELPTISVWASLTNLWLGYHNLRHNRFLKIDEAHREKGHVVRIGPNSVSISDPDAIKDVHGHGTKIIKGEFYDIANPSVHQSMAETRSNLLHHKKRKLLAHVFSATQVQEVMEPIVQSKAQLLVDAMDMREGSVCNMKLWFDYFAYDVISDILFSDSYDFLRKGDDLCIAETFCGKQYQVNAGYSFQNGSTFTAFIGHFSPHVADIFRVLLKWTSIKKSSQDFTNMVNYKVNKRLGESSDNKRDVLSLLKGMSKEEVFAECSTLLNAGNDTTHNSLTNALYMLITNPDKLNKLREILDEIDPADGDVYVYDQLKGVEYLRACIDETFRVRPPVGFGLPRLTPPEGTYINGRFYKGHLTVSTPIYTINRDPNLMNRPEEFIPERWIEGPEQERSNLKTYCLPFLTGSRACIGRNLAYLEQSVLLASLVRSFDFQIMDTKPMRVIERFNSNPEKLNVKLSRRVARVSNL